MIVDLEVRLGFLLENLGQAYKILGSCYDEVCWHLYELIDGLVDVLTI